MFHSPKKGADQGGAGVAAAPNNADGPKWWRQLAAALVKNFHVKRRTPVSSFMEIVMPTVFFVLLSIGFWLSPANRTPPAPHSSSMSTNLSASVYYYDLFCGGDGLGNCNWDDENLLCAFIDPVNWGGWFCGDNRAVEFITYLITRIETPTVVPDLDTWAMLSAMYMQIHGSHFLQRSATASLHHLGYLLLVGPDEITNRFKNHLIDKTINGFNLVNDQYGPFATADAAEDFVVNNGNIAWAILDLSGVGINSIDGSYSSLDYTIRMNYTATPWTFKTVNKFTQGLGHFDFMMYYTSGFLSLQQFVNTWIMEELADNVFDATSELIENPLYKARKPMKVVAHAMPTRGYYASEFLVQSGHFIPLVAVFSLLYALSRQLSSLVEEKEARIREAMLIMGLPRGVFYSSWIISSSTIHLVGAIFSSIVMRKTMFQNVDYSLLLVINYCFTLTVMSLGMLLSVFFSKPRIAAIFGPLLMFIAAVPFYAIPMGTPNSYLLAASVLPCMAYAQAIQLMTNYASNGFPVTWVNFFEGQYSLFVSFLFMVLDSVLYLALAYYFDNVLPSEFGVKSHPLFPLFYVGRKARLLWRAIRGLLTSSKRNHANDDGGIHAPLLGHNSGHTHHHNHNDHNHGNDDDEHDGHHQDDTHHIAAGFIEPFHATTPVVVEISGLSKTYKSSVSGGEDIHAVRSLSTRLHDGHVHVLLGHNGAGKSTTINMIVGLIPATAGSISVCGYDAATNMDRIRQRVGYCPQHNIIWPNLTVDEHLTFYARMKSSEWAVAEAVAEILALVQLEDQQHCKSSALSGGQKRKLCVGISLIGGSPFLVLDEPTAGMDLEARRAMWDMLANIRRSRCILLSTHFLDEADILGDRIIIMHRGRIHSCGSSMFLKTKLGVGYVLNCVLTTDAPVAVQALEDAVGSAVPEDVRPTDVLRRGREVAFRFPVTFSRHAGAVYRVLEAKEEALHLRYTGLSLTTLEDVFTNISLTADQEEEEEEGQEQDHRAHSYRDGKTILQEEATGSNAGDALVKASAEGSSLLVVGGGGGYGSGSPQGTQSKNNSDLDPQSELSSVAKLANSNKNSTHQWDPQDELDQEEESLLYHEDHRGDLDDDDEDQEEGDAADGMLRQSRRQRRRKGCGARCCASTALFGRHFKALFLKRVHCAKRDRRMLCFQVVMPVFFLALALLTMLLHPPRQPKIALDGTAYHPQRDEVSFPMEVAMTPAVSIMKSDKQYSGGAGLLNNGVLDSDNGGIYVPLVLQPDGCANQPLLNSSWSYNIAKCGSEMAKPLMEQYNSHSGTRFIGVIPYGVATDASGNNTEASMVFHNATAPHSLPEAMNELDNIAARYAFRDSTLKITPHNHPMPMSRSQQQLIDSIKRVVSAIFIMIPFTFIPANYVAFIVKEAECKARHLQWVAGASTLAFWLSSFLWDLFLFVVTEIIAICIFFAFGRKEFIGDFESAAATFCLFFFYGLSSIPQSYVISFFFKSHTTAQNMTMLGNFFFGFLLVLASQILSVIPLTKATNIFLCKIYRIVPSYALGEGIIVMTSRQLAEYLTDDAPSPFAFIEASEVGGFIGGIGTSLLYLGCSTPVYFLMLFIVERVRHARVAYALRSAREQSEKDTAAEEGEGEDEAAVKGYDPVDNADVIQEIRAVRRGDYANHGVSVCGLRKTFGKKVAVNNVHFGVKNGETFGLLGTNGAGKTTTISILTGEQAPTSGEATVAGNSIIHAMERARMRLGYCPQFDALLDHMTPSEHLFMYLRLRGMKEKYVSAEVDRLLDSLALMKYKNTMSKALSGGNKRKLSLAIALTGQTRVVLLDEPSAGMDPMARRGLWKCLKRASTNKALILTTHHLEEVEALADRVGIMVLGRMKALGTLQELKGKYSGGVYELQVSFANIPTSTTASSGHHASGEAAIVVTAGSSSSRIPSGSSSVFNNNSSRALRSGSNAPPSGGGSFAGGGGGSTTASSAAFRLAVQESEARLEAAAQLRERLVEKRNARRSSRGLPAAESEGGRKEGTEEEPSLIELLGEDLCGALHDYVVVSSVSAAAATSSSPAAQRREGGDVEEEPQPQPPAAEFTCVEATGNKVTIAVVCRALSDVFDAVELHKKQLEKEGRQLFFGRRTSDNNDADDDDVDVEDGDVVKRCVTISEYTLSQSTLEQVFLRVGFLARHEDDDDEDKDKEGDNDGSKKKKKTDDDDDDVDVSTTKKT